MSFHEYRDNLIFSEMMDRLRAVIGPFEPELVRMMLDYGWKRKYTRNETVMCLLYSVIPNEKLLKCVVNYQNPRHALYVPIQAWFCHGNGTVLPIHKPSVKIHTEGGITAPHTREHYVGSPAALEPTPLLT